MNAGRGSGGAWSLRSVDVGFWFVAYLRLAMHLSAIASSPKATARSNLRQRNDGAFIARLQRKVQGSLVVVVLDVHRDSIARASVTSRRGPSAACVGRDGPSRR